MEAVEAALGARDTLTRLSAAPRPPDTRIAAVSPDFPVPLDQYPALPDGTALLDVLAARAQAEPFNVVGTGIFLMAILHTFAA